MSNNRKQVALTGRKGNVTDRERALIEGAINMPKGLHKKSVGRRLNLGSDDRLLLLGPQEIPLGSEINVGVDAEMAVV